MKPREPKPYAITGITGKVGGALANALLARGQRVRAVVRDADKGASWAERGCEVVLGEMQDATSLSRAFESAAGVFILPPSEFDPSPGFPEARAVISAVKAAFESVTPVKAVCLSTVGAQATRTNLLTQRTLLEQALSPLSMPIAFLRPAWFLDNIAWDIASARAGVIHSFLQPLNRAIPMVASADVGLIAAELMLETWTGRRVIELEGPNQISPDDIAATFAAALGHSVQASAVSHAEWEALFRSQGMKDPVPRIQMLDGFNEGWISFEGPSKTIRKGHTTLATVVRSMIAKEAIPATSG